MPPLRAGDRLDQPTFHARYEALPTGTLAEPIEGVVHMPSPWMPDHGTAVDDVAYRLTRYRKATPGTRTSGGATCIMGVTFEPQPDGLLLIVPECGGQVRYRRGYAEGAPELVVEVAWSTEAIDLHAKRPSARADRASLTGDRREVSVFEGSPPGVLGHICRCALRANPPHLPRDRFTSWGRDQSAALGR